MQRSINNIPTMERSAAFLFARGRVSHVRKAILTVAICIVAGMSVSAQEVPRFEVGGTFNALRNGQGDIGPGARGVFNLGRFVSIEGELNWFPVRSFGVTSESITEALFGGKAGYRFRHIGIFGKARAGFTTVPKTLREETIDIGTGAFSTRFGRLTERVVDLGAVIEYYPAKHWAFRWDFGDALIFHELPQIHVLSSNTNVTFIPTSPSLNFTNNNFQFSAGVQYRF
ncbi:MAG TPA: outer membrane beta-barrel protein [Candidatus Angelobacter sp.]|nr:outer membrane beta-barrel protein [Candidatus Angelobacter sp.]